MKRVAQCLALSMLVSFLAGVHAESKSITSNIILRVFLVRYHEELCSSFTIEVDGRQYLITAKHNLRGIKNGDLIQIRQKQGWHSLSVRPIYCEPLNVDIIVLALPQQISPAFPLAPTLSGAIISQDVYFLGFPYGLHSTESELSNWFPIPFVKKGILSALSRNPKGFTVIYVDGHNNPGFSGGPIVFMNEETKQLKVAGVISGYRNQRDKVIAEIKKSQRREPTIEETNLIVMSNSGILVGHSIENAIEAIKQNPIGPKVSQ